MLLYQTDVCLSVSLSVLSVLSVTLVHCGQTVGWINMKLGMQVCLDPDHIVLDGAQLTSHKRGRSPPIFGPCPLWPNGWMDQDATWHGGIGLGPGHIVLYGEPDPLPKGAQPPIFDQYLCCGRMAGWIKMPLGREIGLSRSDIVDGEPAPPSPKGSGAPNFRPMSIVATVTHLSYC